MFVRGSILLLVAVCLLPGAARSDPPPVYGVLFTHIEDQTPTGTLGSAASRQNYLLYRTRLISLATLARDSAVAWSLQPDWKFLQAALLYEDSTLTPSTNGKNLLRYLKEDLGTFIDPHSHEGSGYNYTDVAHLLDSLGVGGSTVIGGHVWDPDLPEFQEWDRYRVPVSGARYPGALWRGDILMGSGTPHHVNDPEVSGVWKPRDRDHYFEHDDLANIVAIGQYLGTLEDIPALRNLYESGVVSTQYMLTTSYHLKPSTITRPGGIDSIRDSVLAPLLSMRRGGMVLLTDFSALVNAWQTSFGSRGYFYDAAGTVGVETGPASTPPPVAIEQCAPNPFRSEVAVRYRATQSTWIRLSIFDLQGREVARLADGATTAGSHHARWSAHGMASGVYFVQLVERSADREAGRSAIRRVVLMR